MTTKTKPKLRKTPPGPSTLQPADNHAVTNARNWLDTIRAMLADYDRAGNAEDDSAQDAARERIQESPLSVLVRGHWHKPGNTAHAQEAEYEILLSTGGPALRIVGDLDTHADPFTATLQWRDWGTPWTDYCAQASESTLLAFARHFYFGE